MYILSQFLKIVNIFKDILEENDPEIKKPPLFWKQVF